MYPDNASDTEHWIKALSNQIDIVKGNKPKAAATTVATPTPVVSIASTPAPAEKQPVAVGT